MSLEKIRLRFGTRGSELALWQTQHVMAALLNAHPNLGLEQVLIKTRGDQILDTPLPQIGGKGLFTAELEKALYEESIDYAVHSLKDLPTEDPAGLKLGAILARANAADVLISRAGYTLESLPKGARLGTSSHRRASQIRRLRPDLAFLDIRGNVDTRIRKALDKDGDYDAIILAFAGVSRLGRESVISQVLDIKVMLPAPAQGAIAVQTRNSPELIQTLVPIHHVPTSLAVTAERSFLAGLGGGCSVPIAAYAYTENGETVLRGRIISLDGKQEIDIRQSARLSNDQSAEALGKSLAQEALEKGVQSLLESNS
jgi:hydroxymethylbilane synthase